MPVSNEAIRFAGVTMQQRKLDELFAGSASDRSPSTASQDR